MALRPETKVALAVGTAATATVGVALWAWSEARKTQELPPRLGRLLCPGQAGLEPAPTASLGRGDFAVVQLQSHDRRFHESTWATILGRTGDAFVAILSGEQIPEGVRPLSTDKHGFRLGHRLILDADCIWEVFRPAEHQGRILCGPEVAELAATLGDDGLAVVTGGLIVQPGDRAEILVASVEAEGTAWHDRVWTRITTISPTGQVITAIVDEDPELGQQHALLRGTVVRYNRDCVIGV